MVNAAYAGGGLEGFGVPSNMDFYAGASAGMSSENGACDMVDGTSSCDDGPTGYKVFAGSRISPMSAQPGLPILGIEAGYIDFGQSNAEGIRAKRPMLPFKANNESSALYLAGMGYMPVAPKTELFGKAGVTYWQQDNGVDVPLDPTKNTNTTENGFGAILGAGAQYKLNENLSIRGEYEQAFGVGKDQTEEDPSLLSVGAVFSTL